jgi:murein DD-endopeptidase MepM/ murein hydrolase activator NlpD
MSDRRAITLLVFASLLAGTLHLARGGLLTPPPSEPAATAAPGAVDAAGRDSAVADSAPRVEIAGVVRSGDLLSIALVRKGLSANLSDKIVNALAKTFDPRQARPGDVFKVVLDTQMSLLGFEYACVTGESYRVEPIGAGLVASLLPERLERRLVRREGALERSLYESIREAGGSPDEVAQFADIFGGAFDFLTESRRGDRFTYVAEGYYDGDRLRKPGRLLFAEYASAAGGRTIDGVYYQPPGSPKGAYYASDGSSLTRAFLRSPLSYRRISSRFSRNRLHPILKENCPHLGVDYAAPHGTPVSSVADGTVTLAGWNGGMGKCVKVRHAGGVTTTYGHLSRIGALRVGERIEQGRVIGYVGSTGRATGPHLHFEIDRNGRHVDPLRFESPGGPSLSPAELPAFQSARDALMGFLFALPAGVPTAEPAPFTAAAVVVRSEGTPRS